MGGQEGVAFNHPELFPGYPDSLRMHNDLAEFVSFFHLHTQHKRFCKYILASSVGPFERTGRSDID